MTTLLTVKDKLLALVLAYPGVAFDDGNCRRDDWRVLDDARGYSVVIKTARASREDDVIDGYGEHGMYQERHFLGLWVNQNIGTGETGLPAITTDLETRAEALKDYLRPFQRLDNTPGVLRARIIETGEPGPNGLRPQSYSIPITMQIDCESEQSDGEAAQR